MPEIDAASGETFQGVVIENPWSALRRVTSARIALGRAGVSQPTRHQLAFQLAHAQARDAVYSELNGAELQHALETRGFQAANVRSAAHDRQSYLLRPDLGRALDAESALRLRHLARDRQHDIAVIVADGLSATATQRHALPLLDMVMPAFIERGWTIAPVAIVSQGRVAIGDETGFLLGAAISVVLIGERPGLSAPDSLGVYLTHGPRPGRTDAERNCISNIHLNGLSYDDAAATLVYLISEARRLGLSGVALKNNARGPSELETRATPGQLTD